MPGKGDKEEFAYSHTPNYTKCILRIETYLYKFSIYKLTYKVKEVIQMYNNEILKERIKKRAEEQGRSVRSVLISCGINTCYLVHLKGEQGIAASYLYRIADELGCSTDYLLGRSDH